MPRRVFITVAEVSGDQHAAQLIRALRRADPTIEVEGLGGPAMREAGATVHHETVSRAAMALHGAKRALEVYRLLRWTREHYARQRPDLHVCIDSSAMNLPFAKMAKKAGVPVLYFVAPQVWASREGRVKTIRRWVDQCAVILPFEEPYYRGKGVDATFVGHPLFDALPEDRLSRVPAVQFPDRPPVLAVIAGSRKSEVRANFPHQLEVMAAVREAFPAVSFVIPTTPAVHELVMELAGDLSGAEIRADAFDELVPRADLCLCKSGTSTLHVAAYHVPMVVVYRINPVLWHLAGRFLIKTRKIALVNILAGQIDLVPEIIPWHGSNRPVADLLIDLLRHPEKLEDQRQKLRALIRPLDRRGAADNAARMALEMMAGKGEAVLADG